MGNHMSGPARPRHQGWLIGLLIALLLIGGGALIYHWQTGRSLTPPAGPSPMTWPEPRLPAPQAAEDPQSPPAATGQAPLQRREDLYEDQQYGFTLRPASGWQNLTTGELRKNYPGARGVILPTTKNTSYLQIEVTDLPPGEIPDPPEKFLSTMQRALSQGGLKVSEAGLLHCDGAPAIALTTTASGIKHPVVARRIWIYGQGFMVQIIASDADGTCETSRQAFSEMISSFRWQTTNPAANP